MRRPIVIFSLTILVLTFFCVQSDAYVHLSVTGTNVNVRTAANTGGKVLTKVNPEDKFIAEDKPVTNPADGSEWYKIVMTVENDYTPLAADERFGIATAYISANFVQAMKLNADEDVKIAGILANAAAADSKGGSETKPAVGSPGSGLKLGDFPMAFGFSDKTGARLLAQKYMDIPGNKADLSKYKLAIGPYGEIARISYAGRQNETKRNSNRDTAYNFDNLRGDVYNAVGGRLAPDKTYILTTEKQLDAALVKLDKPGYTEMDDNVADRISKQKKRRIQNSELLATTKDGGQIWLVLFERKGKSMLFSIVYMKGNKTLFWDVPAEYDETSTWRVDMGDEPGSFEPLFAARLDNGLVLALTWGAPEGESLVVLYEDNGKFIRSDDYSYSRYWVPDDGMWSDDFTELCKSGTAQQIESEIKKGVNVNERYGNDSTALMFAAEYNGRPEAITALIKAGADVNAKDEENSTALMYAAWGNKNPEVIKTLIKNGADINARADVHSTIDKDLTALMFAAQWNGNPEVTAALIKAGADVKAKDGRGMTALMYAVQHNNNLEVVSLLIKSGADISASDKYGWTALKLAARNGKPETISLLLKNGADVNEKNSDGKTALMSAMEGERNPVAITMFIENGADVNAKNKWGGTALMSAVGGEGNPEIIATLIKNGADVNARNEEGKTALIQAAQYTQNPEIITVLLKNGADAKVKDKDGKRAIDYALLNKYIKDTKACKELEAVSR